MPGYAFVMMPFRDVESEADTLGTGNGNICPNGEADLTEFEGYTSNKAFSCYCLYRKPYAYVKSFKVVLKYLYELKHVNTQILLVFFLFLYVKNNII